MLWANLTKEEEEEEGEEEEEDLKKISLFQEAIQLVGAPRSATKDYTTAKLFFGR